MSTKTSSDVKGSKNFVAMWEGDLDPWDEEEANYPAQTVNMKQGQIPEYSNFASGKWVKPQYETSPGGQKKRPNQILVT